MADLHRPLRADAKRNLDLLVDAAKAEFSEHGANASLEDVAKRAGVGIGTLYRKFPTRDDLIACVLSAGNAAIVARATELLTCPQPAEALAEWLRALVDHVTTYRGLIGTVAASFVAETGTSLCATCDAIQEAGARLLARAQKAGEIRPDAQIREVILTAHSAAWIAEQTHDPGAVDRLLGILFDGLRAPVAPVSAGAPARAGGRRDRSPSASRSKPAGRAGRSGS
ncbi:MAG TPA: helix-turn-helix domain-containing protein [Kofleriaceae bacterium]